MKKADIKYWLSNWKYNNMVNIDVIMSVQDMHEARRFCPCMRIGKFEEILDSEMWEVLQEMRNTPIVIYYGL